MQHWETQVKLGQQFSLSRLKLKFLGLKKFFRYTFMTLLKLFYFTNFSSCQLKKWSTGKFRFSQVSSFILMAGIKSFGPQKILRYTFMTLLKLFYFTNFSLCQLKKWSTGKLRLRQVSSFDSHSWHKKFWASKFFQVYIYDPS